MLTCIAAYLPAINNSFISDDFTLIRFLESLRQDPRALWYTVSELFRAVSYGYYAVTFGLFGLRPELHYIASIALHAAVSLLVFALLRALGLRLLTAWTAAIFFAAYARHEEAVMWISANNSTIITLNCLIFLLIWEHYLKGERSRVAYSAALGVFILALFSKETSVVLVPLAMLRMIMRRHSLKDVFRETWPLLVICGGYVGLWLSQAHRNFFVADGHYTIGLHFLTVYVRSLLSLLSSAIPFLAALLIVGRRPSSAETGKRLSLRVMLHAPDFIFFLTWILLTLVPVSFQTYSKYIASRNTYLPSVALAALVGIFFTVVIDNATTVRVRNACGVLLAGVLMWNLAYLYRKQDVEYVKRAAPTRELIALLNGNEFSRERSISVCGFPLHPSIGLAAVATFTKVRVEDVRFPPECPDGQDIAFARWDEARNAYVAIPRKSVGLGVEVEVPPDAMPTR